MLSSDYRGYKRLLIAVSAAAFLVYGFFLPRNSFVFNSPDERANAFFAEQVAQRGTLAAFDPITLNFPEITPRSFVAVNGFLSPGGFWGLPLVFGAFGRVLGASFIFLLTPLLAILGVWSLFGLVRTLFDNRVAFWSALIAFLHPAVLFYASRNFFPNMAFTALLAITAYFFVSRPFGRTVHQHGSHQFAIAKYLDGALGWLALALALLIRPSEITWIVLIAMILGLAFWKNLRWPNFFLGLYMAAFFLTIVFITNNILYLNGWTFGYNFGSLMSSVLPSDNAFFAALSGAVNWLFPFGWHPLAAIKNVWHFYYILFWFFSFPVLLGLWLFFKEWIHRRLTRPQKWFALSWIIMTIWLFMEYGSWQIQDNPSGQITIGTGYIRYWLPSFFFSAPFIALVILKISQSWPLPRLRTVARWAFFSALAIGSVIAVYFRADGLLHTRQFLRESNGVKTFVLAHTPDDAVIITDTWDKVFFPERHVWPDFDEVESRTLFPKVAAKRPLYYYGEPLVGENLARFTDEGWRVLKVAAFGNEELARIVRE